MKKKIIAVITIIIGVFVFLFYQEKVHVIITNEKVRDIYNSLSINLETETGSGIYEESKSNAWPTDGYVFNETLSKCERGSEITWDNTNKRVAVSSVTNDKCYVYFDKDDGKVKILNVSYDFDSLYSMRIYSVELSENKKVNNVYFRMKEGNNNYGDYVILTENLYSPNFSCGGSCTGVNVSFEIYAEFDDNTTSKVYTVTSEIKIGSPEFGGGEILVPINIIYNGVVIQEYGGDDEVPL